MIQNIEQGVYKVFSQRKNYSVTMAIPIT